MSVLPQSFQKFNVEVCPQGQTVNFEEVTYEATHHDISYIERFGESFKIEDFERMVDVFEKLTAHSEFMEGEDNC